MGSGVAMSSSVRQSAAVLISSSRGVRGDDLAVRSVCMLHVERMLTRPGERRGGRGVSRKNAVKPQSWLA